MATDDLSDNLSSEPCESGRPVAAGIVCSPRCAPGRRPLSDESPWPLGTPDDAEVDKYSMTVEVSL